METISGVAFNLRCPTGIACEDTHTHILSVCVCGCVFTCPPVAQHPHLSVYVVRAGRPDVPLEGGVAG